MIMYTVTVHNHDKDWRRGDLEDKFELVESKNFKTRTDAKAWIERELRGLRGTKRTEWHKGDHPSYGYCWTGVTWQHENSGEEMEEYWQYTLRKGKLN